MFIKNKFFFKPSKNARILAILESLKADSSLSQSEIGLRSDLSSAMVNSYLKQFQNESLIRLKPLNGKSFAYQLTDKGEENRKELLGEYCAEIVQIYSAIKTMVWDKLSDLQQSGVRNLALFGASETCEIALSALKDSNFRIMALIDNDPEKRGQFFHGLVISPPDILESIKIEAVVITSFAHQQTIIRQLQPLKCRRNFKIMGL